MSSLIHTGGKALKSAVALRVGKAILKKRALLFGIGLAGIGVLAAVGTSFIIYSLVPREARKTTKNKASKFFKKLKLHKISTKFPKRCC